MSTRLAGERTLPFVSEVSVYRGRRRGLGVRGRVETRDISTEKVDEGKE